MVVGPVAPEDLRIRRAEQWRERLANADPDGFIVVAEWRACIHGSRCCRRRRRREPAIHDFG